MIVLNKYINIYKKTYNRFLKVFIIINFILILSTSSSFAHKVNIFAYVEKGTVYTESYFPDGKKVTDGLIEVYDSKDNKLLEGRTSKDGLFNFKIPANDNLKIVLTASLGDRKSVV